jgi:hypothetical protein
LRRFDAGRSDTGSDGTPNTITGVDSSAVASGQERIVSGNQETEKRSPPSNGFVRGDVNEPGAPQTDKGVRKMPNKPNKGKGAEGDGEEE